jgi:predicted permease
VMAGVGFLLLGVSWPKRWIGRPQVLMTLRGLSLHYTIVPSILGLATLAGVDLPGAVWLLAFGPIPTSVVSFAHVYGYSPKTAASGLAISIACAIVLLPLSLTLAGL